MAQRGGDPRDAEIGKRVPTLRLQRGLSQTELGALIDVTFQQIQKYEKGTNAFRPAGCSVLPKS